MNFSAIELDWLFAWAESLAKNQVTLRMGDISLAATSDRESHWQALRDHCMGFFKISPTIFENIRAFFIGEPCLRAYLMDCAQGANLGHQKTWAQVGPDCFIANYYEPDDPTCVSYLLLDRGSQRVLTSYPTQNPLSELIPTRVLRAWMATRLFEQGWVYLHASAACIGQETVVILGPKTSGKTYTLINLILSRLFAPISNSKLACKQGKWGVNVKGFPMRAGIRRSTFATIPEVLAKLESTIAKKQPLSYSSNEGKTHLHLYNLALSLGVMPRSGGILRQLIVPVYDPSVRSAYLLPISDQEKKQILYQQHLSRIREIVPFQGFFECMSVIKSTPKKLLNQVLRNIPMHWLIQNEFTNQQSITLISGLITDKEVDHEPDISVS